MAGLLDMSLAYGGNSKAVNKHLKKLAKQIADLEGHTTTSNSKRVVNGSQNAMQAIQAKRQNYFKKRK